MKREEIGGWDVPPFDRRKERKFSHGEVYMRVLVSRVLFLLIFCSGADAWAHSESEITLPPLVERSG